MKYTLLILITLIILVIGKDINPMADTTEGGVLNRTNTTPPPKKPPAWLRFKPGMTAASSPTTAPAVNNYVAPGVTPLQPNQSPLANEAPKNVPAWMRFKPGMTAANSPTTAPAVNNYTFNPWTGYQQGSSTPWTGVQPGALPWTTPATQSTPATQNTTQPATTTPVSINPNAPQPLQWWQYQNLYAQYPTVQPMGSQPPSQGGFSTSYNWDKRRKGGGGGGGDYSNSYSPYSPSWMMGLNSWNFNE